MEPQTEQARITEGATDIVYDGPRDMAAEMAAAVVLFDFGGTLGRTEFAVWADAYLPLLRQYGFKGSIGQVAAAWQQVWETIDTTEGIDHSDASVSPTAYDQWRGQVEALAVARLGIARPAADLIEGLLAIQDSRRYSLYDDALPTLAALRESGYRIGIVSNFNWQLPAIVEHLGLMAHVEHVIVSARAGYRKPHPEIFRRALAVFGVSEQEAIYVGDSPHVDVDGARRAGLSAVLLDRHGIYDCDAPTIHTLGQLLGLQRSSTG